VKLSFPTRRLPERPDLEQLKRQAKELLDAYLAADESAVAEVQRFYRAADPATFALHDAQLVLARNYGYGSWPKLKAYVDGVTATRLMEAVRANDIEQVRGILRIRPELVNFEEPGTHGHSALHYAVMNRMPEMVRILMQLGANPNATVYPRYDASTPLIIAIERGYDEIAATIREEEKRREAGRPTTSDIPAELHKALQSGDEQAAIAVLERHPDLVAYRHSETQRTFLHIAAARLLPRVATWLLDHGTDVNVQAADQSTPLEVAGILCNPNHRAEGVAEMTGLLRERGASITPRAAVILGDIEFLRRKHSEEDIVTPREDRGCLLALAVDCNRPEILKLLLDFGLDPDARVRVSGEEEPAYTWGMPLYQCARYGKYEMAEMLLQYGADPNGQVYASGIPLSEAYGQRDDKMIALLERYGGQSGPSMAGLYRRPDLARKLLEKYGDTPLPDDGFGKGPVAEQLIGAAARGGDAEIFRMALEYIHVPDGDARWNGLLLAPLGFWNHWIGPWCHPEWDRTGYLEIFRMILERSGPPNAPLRNGTTILHEIVTTDDHVTDEERVAFATAALDAGARLDVRDEILKSTPLGWACRWGREELVHLFLARGADPVERDTDPWARPLAWAEKKGHDAIATILRQYRQS
jgi:ankyrin repeat protein